MSRALSPKRFKQAVNDMSIRNKLFIAFLLLNFIPFAILGTLTYSKSNSIIQEKTNDYTIDLLHEVSKNIELHLREIDRMYTAMFMEPEVRSALMQANAGELSAVDYVTISNRVNALLLAAIIDREEIEAVHIFSLNGDVFYSGDRPPALRLSTSDWDQIIGNKGNLIWLQPEDGSRRIAAGSSIYDVDNLEKIGYFILSYKQSALDGLYNHIKLHDQGELFIVNQSGRTISRGDSAAIGAERAEPYIDRVVAGGRQGNFAVTLGHRPHIVTYSQIGETGWKIVSVIPSENYSMQSLLLRNWMLVIFLITFCLAIVLAYYVSSGISRPIRQLSEMMKHVESDRLDVSFRYNSRNEIGVLSRNFNRMIERISYLINQVYQEELLKQRTQLKYLMFQINPHFLFNTLETINWLARIQGAPDVGKLSKALGDLMREAIKGVEIVTLDREVTNVNKYVYIQQHRYANKFEIDMHLEQETLRVMVPRFILQPLVENAIVHGLETKLGRGSIEIRSRFVGDELLLTVRDDGTGIAPERLAELQQALSGQDGDAHTGIGLTNVHRRIRLHYGDKYGLEILSEPDRGTLVRLTLPKDGIK